MDLAPWKVMAGLAGALVIIGVAVQLPQLSPIDILFVVLFGGALLAAMYFGWQIGQRLGK